MEKENICVPDGIKNAGFSLHYIRGLECRPLECRPFKYRKYKYNQRQPGEGLPRYFFHVRCMANNMKNSMSIVERTDVFHILKLVPGMLIVERTGMFSREVNFNWSIVICQGSTRSELP